MKPKKRQIDIIFARSDEFCNLRHFEFEKPLKLRKLNFMQNHSHWNYLFWWNFYLQRAHRDLRPLKR